MIFLIVYDRHQAKLLEKSTFHDQDRDAARTARSKAESEVVNSTSDPLSIEIVLLQAESESDLRKTHARYFENPRTIAHSSTG